MKEENQVTGVNRREFIARSAVGAAALAAAGVIGFPSAARADEIVLPKLPYAENALEPYISARTISFHYGKHHAGYVKNTNKLIKGTPFEKESLEKIIVATVDKPDQVNLFNNAAQVWNHTFYWNSMKPSGGAPGGALLKQIEADFGSLDKLREEFLKTAVSQFGSGWGWLVVDGGKLKVIKTGNADTPIAHGLKPILTIDVWEHAYYLDYQNLRAKYVKGLLDHLMNWDFAAKNFAA